MVTANLVVGCKVSWRCQIDAVTAGGGDRPTGVSAAQPTDTAGSVGVMAIHVTHRQVDEAAGDFAFSLVINAPHSDL